MEVDCLVVGSGAAAMTAALRAHAGGMRTLVVEKTDSYGGTTALSGGVVWVPNNHLLDAQQDSDSAEDALTYLRACVGNRVSEERLRAFVDTAPRMLRFLSDNGHVSFDTFVGFPDYFAELPGGKTANRSVEPQVLDGSRLGALLASQRSRTRPVAPGGLVGTMAEMRALAEVRARPLTALKAWRVVPRSLWARMLGRPLLSSGQALVGWLRLALERSGIDVQLNTELVDLRLADGQVTGALLRERGVEREVRASAVIIGSGGFEHNEAMRRRFQGEDATSDWTSGSLGNTGGGIEAGMRAGAHTDLMEDAWWAPTVLMPDGTPQIVIFERGKPGFVIVNRAGDRYVNEAAPYNEVVKAQRENHAASGVAVPSFMIMDATYRNRYPFVNMLPGVTPQSAIESGMLVRANSIAELARTVGVDERGLERTLTRFNDMARNGRDEDFQRGEHAFDRFSGDPSVHPNCCLAPVETPPFYAAKLYPGDLGTKGGLATDAHARVLGEGGQPIEGLYAAGNASASVMGETYPGAGGTIGPAMTFGYIAGQHAAERFRNGST